jgi:hypothetical protein
VKFFNKPKSDCYHGLHLSTIMLHRQGLENAVSAATRQQSRKNRGSL